VKDKTVNITSALQLTTMASDPFTCDSTTAGSIYYRDDGSLMLCTNKTGAYKWNVAF